MEYLSAKSLDNLTKHKHPILFLHGAYCDSWVYKEHFLEYFSNQGFDCYTLDFQTEASFSLLSPITLQTYVDQVLEAIDEIGVVPIIVAHSMAGAVIQKLYQKHKIKFPAWVLIAPAPARNFYESSQNMLINNTSLFSQMYMFQLFGKNFASDTLVKQAMFSDSFDEKKANSYIDYVKTMPNSLVFDILTTNIPDKDLQVKFPILLQAAKQDRLISAKCISLIEKTYNIKAIYYNSGHAIMLDNQWQKSADDIIKFINKLK